MNEYLVMYQPPNDNKYYPFLHIWPEILTMLIKIEEFGGHIRIYRLDKKEPEPVGVVCVDSGEYYLNDVYGNYLEG